MTSRIGRIAAELSAAAIVIARLIEVGVRQAEIRRRPCDEECPLRAEQQERARRIRVRDDARKDLMQAIEAWGEVIGLARVLIGEHEALGALLVRRSPDER